MTRPATALAAPDGDEPGVEVEVADCEGDNFAEPDSGFDHETDDRLVPDVAQRPREVGIAVDVRLAGLQECAYLRDRERVDDGLVELGRGHPLERCRVEVPDGEEPGGVAPYGLLSDPCGAGRATGTERVGDPGLQAGAPQRGRSRLSAQSRYLPPESR